MANIVNRHTDDTPELYIDKPDNYQLVDKVIKDDSGTMGKAMESKFLDISNMANADKKMSNKERKRIGKKKDYIYHMNTSNKSFLELYNDLYHLGIKNNKFFLKLYDRDLEFVNPHQANLPLELQLKIIFECIRNPWYFLREVCRIPEDGKPIEPGGGTQYIIDRNNLAVWYLILNGIDVYASKPRQTGKTQNCLALINYAYHFGTQSTEIAFFNKKTEDAQMNLARLKTQRDLLPVYMHMKLAFVKNELDDEEKVIKETDNIKTMINPVNNNKIKTFPRATSKEAAMSLGRGNTCAMMASDEFDFQKFNLEIINSSAPAYSRASENAEKNGAMHGRIFTSTPGDLDMSSGADAARFIRGGDGMCGMFVWKDEYFDIRIDKLKKMIQAKGYNGVCFVEHTWRQLKKDINWYERQCRLLNYQQEVIAREIDLKRLRGSNQSPFSPKDLFYLSTHIKKPIEEIKIGDYMETITVYEKINRNYHYILSIDPSEGLGQDNNAMVLINPYTLHVAAEWQCPYISQPELCKFVCKFMDKYCKKSMILVENNKGRDLLNRLDETKYRYNVFYDAEKLGSILTDQLDKYGAKVESDVRKRRAAGIGTGKANRPLYYAILENWVVDRKQELYSEYLVTDILGLIRKPNGRIEAGPGNHDDMVMAYFMGLYVYYNANNLEDYGIIRGQTEPVDVTDPAYIKDKLKSLIAQLPTEMRKDYAEYGMDVEKQERDSYRRELDNARRLSFMTEREMGLVNESEVEEYEEGRMYEDDQERIQQFIDNRLFENQERLNNRLNSYDGGYDYDDDTGSSGGFDAWYDD